MSTVSTVSTARPFDILGFPVQEDERIFGAFRGRRETSGDQIRHFGFGVILGSGGTLKPWAEPGGFEFPENLTSPQLYGISRYIKFNYLSSFSYVYWSSTSNFPNIPQHNFPMDMSCLAVFTPNWRLRVTNQQLFLEPMVEALLEHQKWWRQKGIARHSYHLLKCVQGFASWFASFFQYQYHPVHANIHIVQGYDMRWYLLVM